MEERHQRSRQRSHYRSRNGVLLQGRRSNRRSLRDAPSGRRGINRSRASTSKAWPPRRLPVASGSASEPSVIGSTEEWLLTRGHDANIPVLSIPTRRMYSGAGKKGSVTARKFGAKSQPKAIQDHNGCSLAFSKRSKRRRWELLLQFSACRTTVRQRLSHSSCVVQTHWMRSNENIWQLSVWQIRLLIRRTGSPRTFW